LLIFYVSLRDLTNRRVPYQLWEIQLPTENIPIIKAPTELANRLIQFALASIHEASQHDDMDTYNVAALFESENLAKKKIKIILRW
jgi:hypothetical protein